MLFQDVRKILQDASDEKYKKFMHSLVPDCQHILGVRMPKIRSIAKHFSEQQMRQYIDYSPHFLEEYILQSVFVAKLFCLQQDFSLISSFVPKINNWAVCDCFCCNLKFSENISQDMLSFLIPYLQSSAEFDVRFGMVMLLNYFIKEDMLPYIFEQAERFNHQAYYAKMSVAWLLSQCFAKFTQSTLSYLKDSSLDKDTYNKTIQKILESHKVSKDFHMVVKGLKRH